MKKFLLFALVLVWFVSCDDRKTPEGALKSFVEARFDGALTREFVLEHVTGKMKQKLESISEEELKKLPDLRNIEKDSFRILSKECQEKECVMLYTVSYKTSQDEKEVFETEVEKKAELQLIKGLWLIADVSNLRTVHEGLEPINPLE